MLVLRKVFSGLIWIIFTKTQKIRDNLKVVFVFLVVPFAKLNYAIDLIDNFDAMLF